MKRPTSLRRLSDDQIEQQLSMLERMIAAERDAKNLPSLNMAFQRLIDEQVRRDLLAQERT